MKKQILHVAIVVISMSFTVANAAWTFAGKVNQYDDEYVNLESVRKNGAIAQMWTMTNAGWAKQSTIDKKEFDCEREMIRSVSSALYDGPMQTGEIIMNWNPAGTWQAVIPDSWGASLLKLACSPKNRR